jgi:hypothetical protein
MRALAGRFDFRGVQDGNWLITLSERFGNNLVRCEKLQLVSGFLEQSAALLMNLPPVSGKENRRPRLQNVFHAQQGAVLGALDVHLDDVRLRVRFGECVEGHNWNRQLAVVGDASKIRASRRKPPGPRGSQRRRRGAYRARNCPASNRDFPNRQSTGCPLADLEGCATPPTWESGAAGYESAGRVSSRNPPPRIRHESQLESRPANSMSGVKTPGPRSS